MINFFLKESVIISTLSILAFVAAYLFECGYSDAFGYDYVFIVIDLKVMVISMACVTIVSFPLVLYFWVFFSLAFRQEKEQRLIAVQMIMPIPVLIFLYMSGFESTVMFWLLCIAVFLAFVTFVRVLFKARKLGWQEAMSHIATAEGIKEFEGPRPKRKEPRVIDKVMGYCAILVILMTLGFIVRGIGSAVAHWKSNYQTFVLDGEEVAIIAAYGERIIVGGVTGDQFNTKITIVPKDSEKLIDLKSAYFTNFLSKPFNLR